MYNCSKLYALALQELRKIGQTAVPPEWTERYKVDYAKWFVAAEDVLLTGRIYHVG